MSANAENTLEEFFGSEPLTDNQAGTIWAGECLSRLGQELQGKVPVPFWSSARRAIDQAMQQLLSFPMSQIVAGGWNQYRALREYRDRKKHPSDEVALFPLGQHTITSTHKPQIEILVNDRRIGAIDFEIKLAMEIEAAILKIQDGKIWEVEVGACRGGGTLMFGPAVLFERKTGKVRLPAVISFPKGLSI
ncbi:MAG: hypothetical protein M3447_13460 [Acidobacteriota bacterium]|nr:hypothetical protein [Acidobacteriota bacterium]